MMTIDWCFWKIIKVRGFGNPLGAMANGPKAKAETEVACAWEARAAARRVGELALCVGSESHDQGAFP